MVVTESILAAMSRRFVPPVPARMKSGCLGLRRSEPAGKMAVQPERRVIGDWLSRMPAVRRLWPQSGCSGMAGASDVHESVTT